MISTKGRYSIRILLDLAEHRSGGYIPMKEVAARQDISLKYIEKLMPALKAALRGVRADVAAVLLDRRAHGLEALDVLVDGTDAEVAAAWHRHMRMAEAAKLHADEIIGRTDAPHQLDRSRGVARMAAVDLHRVAGKAPDIGAHVAQNFEQQTDIGNIGNVFDPAGAVDEQCRRENCNRRVLRAGDGDGAAEPRTALNVILNQIKTLFMGRVFALLSGNNRVKS